MANGRANAIPSSRGWTELGSIDIDNVGLANRLTVSYLHAHPVTLDRSWQRGPILIKQVSAGSVWEAFHLCLAHPWPVPEPLQVLGGTVRFRIA